MGDFNHSLNIIEHDKYTKNVRSAIVDCLTTINNDQQRMYPISQQTLKEISSLDARIDKVEYDLGVLSKQISIYKDHVESQEAKLVELSAADASQNQQITNATNTVNINVNTINDINNKLSGYEDVNNDNRTIAESNSAELEQLYSMVNSDKMINFEDTHINAVDSIKGMTGNTEIRGRTIQNLWDTDNKPITSAVPKWFNAPSDRILIPDETYTCFATLTSDIDVTVRPEHYTYLFRVDDGKGHVLGGFTGSLKRAVKTRVRFTLKAKDFGTFNSEPDAQKCVMGIRLAPPYDNITLTVEDVVLVHGNWMNKEELPYIKGMRSSCDTEKRFRPRISRSTRWPIFSGNWYIDISNWDRKHVVIANSYTKSYVYKVKKGKIYTWKNGGNRNTLGFFSKRPEPGSVATLVKVDSTSDINKGVIDIPGDGYLMWYVNTKQYDDSPEPTTCVVRGDNDKFTDGATDILPEPMTIQTSHNNGLMSVSDSDGIGGYIGDIIKRTPNGIQVEENITKFVLNGTSDHVYRRNSQTTHHVLFYLDILNDNYRLVSEYGLCDKYPVLPYHKAAASQFNFKYVKFAASQYIFINVPRTELSKYGGTEVEHFRKYLAANPITVYCKTKTVNYVDVPRVNDMEFKTYDMPYGTYISSDNEIAPIIKTMVPCDPNAVIATLRRSNLSLQDDNLKLRTRVANLDETARQQDLHQAAVDLDVDFRLYMMERSNQNSREQLSDESIVKTEPSLQFNLMKKLIDAGMYDKNDFINKALYYTDGGILSQNEYKQITEMMKGGNI